MSSSRLATRGRRASVLLLLLSVLAPLLAVPSDAATWTPTSGWTWVEDPGDAPVVGGDDPTYGVFELHGPAGVSVKVWACVSNLPALGQQITANGSCAQTSGLQNGYANLDIGGMPEIAPGVYRKQVRVYSGFTLNWAFAAEEGASGSSTSSPALAVWSGEPYPQPCSRYATENCDPMGTGVTVETMPGSDADSLQRCTGGSAKPHCLGWASTHWYTWDADGERRPHPSLTGPAPKRWTFYVEDYGWNLTPLGAETYVVGWTCARQGPLYGQASNHEGYATWRGGQTRKFEVAVCDAPGTYLWNFYVLREQVPGIADYDAIEVFWGYGRPGGVVPTHDVSNLEPVVCVAGCGNTVPPGPAPVSAPAPSTVAPDDGGAGPVVGPQPGSGCDFGITDPTSWLCGLSGLLGRLLDVAGAILSAVGRLVGHLLSGLKTLFIPGPGTFDKLGELRTAFTTHPPGSILVGGGQFVGGLATGLEGAGCAAGPDFSPDGYEGLMQLPGQCDGTGYGMMDLLYGFVTVCLYASLMWSLWSLAEAHFGVGAE